MSQKPKVQSSELAYHGFFDIQKDVLERADGLTHAYTSLILSTDAAAVLAQDREGLWILNREYRHPTGQFLLGCPGGRLEVGEDPLVGGARELFEETGYWSDEIVLLGSSYPFPGLCNQVIYYLYAKNAFKKGEQHLDPFEFIQVELKTDEELREEIRKGVNIDGILCTALWYKDQWAKPLSSSLTPSR
jgi:ADP-ribose pyrophosphatase